MSLNEFKPAQLRERGFVEIASGVWRKTGPQDDDPRPPASNVEPSSRREPKRKNAHKSGRKKALQKGIRYRLVVHSYRTKLIDMSNPYLKALEDCLTSYGVIPDDGPEFCDQPIFLETKVMPGDERTKVTVLAYHQK